VKLVSKLVFRKIIKIAATSCHILKLKCTKHDFGWGSPRPSIAVLKGTTSKGKGREGRRGEDLVPVQPLSPRLQNLKTATGSSHSN